jgi:hypothetical protein
MLGTCIASGEQRGKSPVETQRSDAQPARDFPIASYFSWGAARQLREAFPAADRLHEAARVIGSTTVDKVRSAGFDVIPNPTRKLPNHHRLIHPEGVAGFNDENLARLSAVFTETSGYAS